MIKPHHCLGAAESRAAGAAPCGCKTISLPSGGVGCFEELELSRHAPPDTVLLAGLRGKQRARARRKLRRSAIRRDIINLYLFRLLVAYLQSGYSARMVSRLTGFAASHLCHLKLMYERGGYSAVAPYLAQVFPEALDMELWLPPTAPQITGGHPPAPGL